LAVVLVVGDVDVVRVMLRRILVKGGHTVSEADTAAAAKAGADRLLLKPIGKVELLEAVVAASDPVRRCGDRTLSLV
jgi:CheY-like chemotaxis protein